MSLATGTKPSVRKLGSRNCLHRVNDFNRTSIARVDVNRALRPHKGPIGTAGIDSVSVLDVLDDPILVNRLACSHQLRNSAVGPD